MENSYCYIHAVDAGLVEVPLEELQTAARQAGYSVNAVIFLMEAMLASGQLMNARDICFSVVKAARKQFGALSSEVFRSWQITHKTDIGKIVAALVAAGFVHEFEGVAQEDFDTPLTLLDVLGLP